MTTYTSIARLPIMVPGDPAVKNAWGTILNTAIPLIEQLAAGSVSVSVTGLASYTLTAATNAPDQARMAFIIFTGAPTAGACTVTIPAVARIGWASNASSGTITLTTGSGTTLALVAGSTYFYRCDGTNITATDIPPTGALNLLGTITLPNNVPYRAKDTGGTARTLLFISSANDTALLNGGGGSLIFGSQAGATLLSLTNAGAASFTAGVSVAGALSVTGTITGSGAINATSSMSAGGGLLLPNAVSISLKDNGGTYRSAMFMGSDNHTNVLNGGGAGKLWRVLNQAGTVALFSVDNSGNTTTAGTLTVGGALTATGQITGASVNAAGGLYLDNAAALNAKDNGGTYRNVLSIGADNNTNLLNGGGANWRVLNQAGSVALVTVDNSGNGSIAGGFTVGASLGVTANLTVTGSITSANTNGTVGTIGGVVMAGGGAISAAGVASLGSVSTGTVNATVGTFTGSTVQGGTGGIMNSAAVAFGAYSNPMSVIATNGIVGGALFASSDRRLKTEIEDLTPEDGYDWIKRGRPRTYLMAGRPHAGFVAQEDIAAGRGAAVASVADERAEFADGDGHAPPGTRLVRRYEHDIAYLTAALQGALARIAALEAALAA